MSKIGTKITGPNCRFTVWAPEKESMILHLLNPVNEEYKMDKDEEGYFTAIVEEAGEGTRYFYRPDDGNNLPDPASNFQPEGVHGPSQVVNHEKFNWTDTGWKGINLKDAVIYEIHTGTFTAEGTFEAIVPYLDDIASIGINVIELMPVAQFPGSRNWGYDGVYPYAVQNSYGGPSGLKKLVNACHSMGIAVFLDVVYNHLGPEGNYFGSFGPYFTRKYQVPWGDAINLDDEWCDGVRDYFSDNPVFWLTNYHIDGIRVDAIHAIYDSGSRHFWDLTMEKIRDAEFREGRVMHVIAESDLNDPKVVKSSEVGGFSFEAQWLDDFHHALYVLLHPAGKTRYADFGRIEQLAKAYKDGFVHSGEMVRFRKRKYGNSSAGIPGHKFVVFNQNHDQIGNRVLGERISVLVGFEQLKLAAAAIILSPYIPMLFMGEEYGEENPFLYFISHSDEALIKAVREGRKKEFEAFKWDVEPPDPQDENTFFQSKLNKEKRLSGKNKLILQWTKELIALRRNRDALRNTIKDDIEVNVTGESGLTILRRDGNAKSYIVSFFNFSDADIEFFVPSQHSTWIKLADSKEAKWNEKKDGSINAIPLPVSVNAHDRLNVPDWSVSVYSGVKER
ncbi:MAG TPA: malto-oligosyltrehalose trehalohydrolase [Bacteroidales bacterium]|nr:malto-oligosyltrehalose trehalohydrolase [Bacteroidales bacterium]